MPKYQVETDRGTFEIEADREPTAQDVEAYFSESQPKEDNRPLYQRLMGLAVPGGTRRATSQEREEKKGANPRDAMSSLMIPGTATAADFALEAGLPMIGQAMATPAGPGVQAAVGGGLSALGNVLAQTRRMITGEQEDFSPGQVAASTAVGAIPFAGPIKNTSRPILSGVLSTARTAATAGAAGVAGKAIEEGIDEGRMITGREAIESAALPAAFTTSLVPIGLIGRRLLNTGSTVRGANAVFSGAGVTPTPGMLLPENLAATEQRVAKVRPTGSAATAVDKAYDDIADAVIDVAGVPQEPAAIFERLSPLLGQVDESAAQLSKLDANAQSAKKVADEAFQALSDQRASMNATQAKEAYQLAESASNEAFRSELGSIVKNAQDLAVASTVAGRKSIDPSTARTLFVEHVALPLQASFDEQAARLYSGVDNQTPLFDTGPIIARTKEAAKNIAGTPKLPPKLAASIEIVQENLGEGKASLQSLRNVRSDLLRRIRLQSYESDAEERLIKGVASEITQAINSQAKSALGEEMGEQLLTANRFYQQKSDLFDQPGVDILFKDDINDDAIRKVVAGMEKSGINSDEYKNLKNLIVKVGEFDKGLSASLKGQANAIVRGSILHDAATISAETGELVIDGYELMKRMDKLAKVDGTLETLGLGDRQKLAELKTLFSAEKYDAVKMTSDQWEDLFRSPNFRNASAGRLASELRPAVAAAQSENLLMRSAQLQAAGKVEEANKLYLQALKTLDEVNGDLLQARQVYENLLNDPVAMAFNNPNLGQNDFNAFADSFFDAKAGKITNKNVEEMVSSLRDSGTPEHEQLLKRLQERYIADRMATFKNSASDRNLDTGKLENFFNPANPSDAANEVERARAVLDSAQFFDLEKFAKVAAEINRYERFATTPESSTIYRLPVVGGALKVVADLWASGKYQLAARALTNPEIFARRATAVGGVASQAAETPALTGAVQSARQITREDNRDPAANP